MNKIRRRLLLCGEDGQFYIFKQSDTKVNGDISRQQGVNFNGTTLRVAVSGYLSVKVDFSKYSTLNFDFQLSKSNDNGALVGFGTSATGFKQSYTKTSGEREVKTFDISTQKGEFYVNLIPGSYTTSGDIFAFNIWLE